MPAYFLVTAVVITVSAQLTPPNRNGILGERFDVGSTSYFLAETQRPEVTQDRWPTTVYSRRDGDDPNRRWPPIERFIIARRRRQHLWPGNSEPLLPSDKLAVSTPPPDEPKGILNGCKRTFRDEFFREEVTTVEIIFRQTSDAYFSFNRNDDDDVEKFPSEPSEADGLKQLNHDHSVDEFIGNEEKLIETLLESAIVPLSPQLRSQKVIKAEKYVLPILAVNRWFQTRHCGVVVTLDDGRRLVILRGIEFFQRNQPTIVLRADIMSDVWKLEKMKNPIFKSILADYIRTADASNSSEMASDRMMTLD